MKVIAFDIGGTQIKCGELENDSLVSFEEYDYPEVGKAGLLQVIFSYLDTHSFDAVGICTAGLVDTENGSIIYCSNAIPNYSGTQLKKIVEEKYSKPAWVINDVNAAALGEAFFGAGKSYKDFICLTYGTGVGGAIVLNRQIYGGSNGYAGEIGHIVTHLDGDECTCGARGCYNAYASTKALVNSCKAVDNTINNGKDVFREFQKGNSYIKYHIDKWIDEVVYGLVTVTHIFNPPAIILGGGIMNEKYVISNVNIKLKEKIMLGYRDIKILGTELGNKAGLMGAYQYTMGRISK